MILITEWPFCPTGLHSVTYKFCRIWFYYCVHKGQSEMRYLPDRFVFSLPENWLIKQRNLLGKRHFLIDRQGELFFLKQSSVQHFWSGKITKIYRCHVIISHYLNLWIVLGIVTNVTFGTNCQKSEEHQAEWEEMHPPY